MGDEDVIVILVLLVETIFCQPVCRQVPDLVAAGTAGVVVVVVGSFAGTVDAGVVGAAAADADDAEATEAADVTAVAFGCVDSTAVSNVACGVDKLSGTVVAVAIAVVTVGAASVTAVVVVEPPAAAAAAAVSPALVAAAAAASAAAAAFAA